MPEPTNWYVRDGYRARKAGATRTSCQHRGQPGAWWREGYDAAAKEEKTSA